MELTPYEQKILDTAKDSDKRNLQAKSKAIVLGLIVGAIGAGMTVIDGVVGLFTGNHNALGRVASGLLLIGFLGTMYESLRFRKAALSLVSKLQE